MVDDPKKDTDTDRGRDADIQRADSPTSKVDADRIRGSGIHNREIERELSVSEVMNKAVIVMDIDSDTPAIAREMVSRDAGSIIVTENGSAMGIITERDFVKGIIAQNRKPSEINASEILSTPLMTVDPATSIIEASRIMLRANIKRLPVIENGVIIGVISNTDILIVTPGLNTILKDLISMNREALISIPSREEIPDLETSRINVCESCDSTSIDLRYVDGRYLCGNCRREKDMEADRGKYAGIHGRGINKVSVAQVMNKAVIVMDINSDASAIAKEMVTRDAGSVIITENGLAMGIVTERDLVRGIVTEDRKPNEIDASELLSSPLITVDAEKSIVEASEIMLKSNIKRLPVLKDDTTVIGVISNTDILMVTPGLNTILKDLIDMNREALLSIPSIEEISEPEDFHSGICESCYTFSYDLRLINGEYICGRCREEVGENYE